MKRLLELFWIVLGVITMILGAIKADNVLIGIAVVCFATDTIIQEIRERRNNVSITTDKLYINQNKKEEQK